MTPLDAGRNASFSAKPEGIRWLLACVGFWLGLHTLSAVAAPGGVERLVVAPGLAVEVYATGVRNARQMALSSSGVLFVGSRDAGRVHAVLPGGDAANRKVVILLERLDMPSGIALHQGDLYIADISRIWKIPAVESRLAAAGSGQLPTPQLVTDSLPKERSHGWRYLRVDAEGRLVVAIGAPCNVCDRDADGFATIVRMQRDGSGREVIARGVRNSVGFDFEPGTGHLWFTDNGRDWMGDDQPECELNRLTQPGQHFGFPFCHQGDLPDPKFGRQRACSEFVSPMAKLGPHTAPLGMTFWQDDVVVALHGSWNRSQKSGYKVVRVRLADGRVTAVEDLVSGWLRGQYVWGRPADVLTMPDGSLLIADDHQGLIYRVFRQSGA